MKRCIKCSQNKENVEFSKRKNGKLQSYCKKCRNEYCKQHYYDNKTKHNIRRALLRKKYYDEHSLMIQSLKNKPCVDCGNNFPFYVMQFDHVCGDKIANVADMPGNYSWNKIEEEILKCELICANCHSIRTYKRKSSS